MISENERKKRVLSLDLALLRELSKASKSEDMSSFLVWLKRL